jgi:flotillin
MAGAAGLFGLAIALNLRYKVSRADQWISKTGLFINDVVIKKKTFLWPYQTYKFINLSPYTVNFTVTAMSNEKLEFGMPVVLTIGPKDEYQ